VIDDDVADAARAVSSSDGFTPAAADVCASLILFVRRLPGLLLDACNGGGMGGSAGRLERSRQGSLPIRRPRRIEP